ncbi:phospho-N-acetylmuramoyl-pentapeptide-transferase [Treponema endosymbiont of Eucomonympha sp.]|uniref:phospho-N-acetylmuramoyl-pentapeptide- transferase n=1 Tax=Treponema endosymbiont of Eucomonympha sp. TaxID=1580831 RepID=UPI0007832C88|nr:phospho-N-acetylmuramoyl-pentapeptide-transferase [Treponema endosymbiont of Eucomonympha sp.]
MLYHLAGLLLPYFGPARLLRSNAVLSVVGIYAGFFLTAFLLPKCYRFLPRDRGREFTPTPQASKGKPTGAGAAFVTLFVLLLFLLAPLSPFHGCILSLTWLTMLTGFLDDRSERGWSEYRKGAFDLLLALAGACVLYAFLRAESADGALHFWLPFVAKPVEVPPAAYIPLAAILLWASINATNCTDGVDGLSGTLVVIALVTMGVIFYFILGHQNIAAYLLVPHLRDGAAWGIMSFALAGVLMGYLWHNAFPSAVLMGDAGSRAIGFFTGACIMASGNPFLILATSSIIFLNGGMGLVKLFLLRFCKVRILSSVRFPLHDHLRYRRGWSATQVLIKFVIMQVLVSFFILGVFFKVR